MTGKLGSNIDKDFKKSSYLDKKQVYLPYDTELLSILKVLTYSPFSNQFTVLFTDLTERKKYEKELKNTVKKLQKSISETIKDTEIHFHSKE